MTAFGACFISKGYITMLCLVSWYDDNCRSHFVYLRDISPCSVRCHETMTTVRACYIPKGYIFHTVTIVKRRLQLSEQVSYFREILPCSYRCHETMTTVGACCIPKGYITMLCPLSLDDDNWRSMLHTCWLYPCSDRCQATITTVGACFILQGNITMLWPLSWDDDNCRSMFHTWMIWSHALTVVMRRLQLSEHVSYQRYIKPCSDRCHETMTTFGACFIDKWHITMLCPLSCDDDNGRSMFHT